MFVDYYCAQCNKQLTFREKSYHNKIEGIDGDVCRRCIGAWWLIQSNKRIAKQKEQHENLQNA